MNKFAGVIALALTFAIPALADDEGHHHENLTDQQLGTVHFPVSCVPSVRKPFERGVALLHSFWYEEAEKEFKQVAKDDPKCAMAQWGLAMSQWHQLWDHPDEATTKKGLEEIEKAQSLHARTRRERAYVGAMKAFYGGKGDYQPRAHAYVKAMEKVSRQNPNDHEAAAFYALSLLAADEGNDPDFNNNKNAAEVLEKLFAVEPDHPGVAHYLIHAYDNPKLAQLGLPAARRYAQIAPMAPHALHMPSHIFARVGLWQDDINSNLASVAATRKTAAMHMGDEGHQFHAMDFLVYAYLQSGRESDASTVIDEVKNMPPVKNMYGMNFDPRVFAQASFEAGYVLELHQWSQAASLASVPGAEPATNATTFMARAIGAARSGDVAGARKDIEELKSIAKTLSDKNMKDDADWVEKHLAEPLAWIDHAEGKDDDAINLLRPLAQKEFEGMSQVGSLPVHEMLADLLLEAKRPEEALAVYEEDLKLNPNRFDALYGAAQAAEAAGKQEKASRYYADLVKSCAGSLSERPELTRSKGLVAQK
jgi:tetratricopeptide (TPR) repeat protein